MANKKVETLLKKINKTKAEILKIENMRPGSVTRQKHVRGKKTWPFWQISYTQNRKSKTEYLRDEFVDQIKTEVKNYKLFKFLAEKLVRLNIELSKEKLKILKNDRAI
ncbi:MAG TPA: hypothetical protein DIW23_15020 [Anaerolineae bacterium]|jgi:hypothetical protein|nr:hypothetical protein [Pseudobdellovibrionaceae bacterium]HCR72754.1 hypothetical protein [Anaerolineae bacterium]